MGCNIFFHSKIPEIRYDKTKNWWGEDQMEFRIFLSQSHYYLCTKACWWSFSLDWSTYLVLVKVMVGIVIGPAVVGWNWNNSEASNSNLKVNVGVILLCLWWTWNDLEELRHLILFSSCTRRYIHPFSIRSGLRFRPCYGNGTRQTCILRITSMCESVSIRTNTCD